MGFNSVFRALQDVFPEVDARLLRAVAIEHSKDADAAVEAILVEIIPYISGRSTANSSSNENEILPDSKGAVVEANDTSRTDDALAVEEANDTSRTDDAFMVDSKCSDEVVNDSSCYETNGGHNQVCGDYGNEELISLGKSEKNGVKVGVDSPSTSLTNDNVATNDLDRDQVCGNTGNEEIISSGNYQQSMFNVESEKSGVKVGLDSPSTSLTHDSVATNDLDHDQVCGNTGNDEIISSGNYQQSTVNIGTDQSSHITSAASLLGDFGKSGIIYDHPSVDFEDNDSNMFINGGSCEEKSCSDGNLLEVEVSIVELAPSPVHELEPSAPESSLELVVVPDDIITGCETQEPHASFDAAPEEKSYASVMAHDEDVSTLNTIATRSGQICRIDLLEDIIEDARCNKKILFSAMESVLILMREVELQEIAAEQAKEEAARGGLDIQDRVEELKELLSRAREANDMHAGEVYGEKAILATEARELQSRLLSLSDERDSSLAILEEMRRTLEVRFAEAERERKAAEQEKLGKEEAANKALSEQKLIMEKVLKESEILKQEAEENSKLQEFLMDRGRVVDMLQGEISVICKDVKLLKEKFDKRVPLSKSLSSDQTSCILASSSSSMKSLAPDQVPEQADPSESPKKTSPSASIDNSLSSREDKTEDDRKALVDAGWEFFDNREFDM